MIVLIDQLQPYWSHYHLFGGWEADPVRFR